MINQQDPSPHQIPLSKLAIEKIKANPLDPTTLKQREKALVKNPKYNSIASGIGTDEIKHLHVSSDEEEQKGSTGDAPVTSRYHYKSIIKLIKTSFEKSSSPPPTVIDFYRVGKILGKGAFGKVNLAKHKLAKKLVAIKSMSKEYLRDEHHKQKVLLETKILKKF